MAVIREVCIQGLDQHLAWKIAMHILLNSFFYKKMVRNFRTGVFKLKKVFLFLLSLKKALIMES